MNEFNNDINNNENDVIEEIRDEDNLENLDEENEEEVKNDNNNKADSSNNKGSHKSSKSHTKEKVVEKITALMQDAKEKGQKVAVIATEETKSFYVADVVLSIGTREEEDSIAKHMYKILRDCDKLDVDVIYSESFKTPRIGQAIMNRLLKAAGHQVIHV